MGEIGVLKASIRTDLIVIWRSNVSLLVLGVTTLISVLVSYSILNSYDILSRVVFQAVFLKFFKALSVYFIIFIIAPALSISTDRESGTWEMIFSRIRDMSVLLFSRIITQIIFAFLLILDSLATLFAMYIAYYGIPPGKTVYSVTQAVKTVLTSPTGSTTTVHHITTLHTAYFSAFGLGSAVFAGLAAIIPPVLVGICISLFSRTRIAAIVVAIGYFLAGTEIYGTISSFTSLTGNAVAGIALSLMPQSSFSMAGEIEQMNTLAIPHGAGGSLYYLSISSPVFSTFQYLVYLAAVIIVLLFFIFLPGIKEVYQWIRQRR